MEDSKVWYVSYGSNMLIERFMCYLTGDALPQYGIKEDKKRKCKDFNPPQESRLVKIPYELYFASNSATWEDKGVAFLKTDKHSGETLGRAYLITDLQFKHVKRFEGKKYQHEINLDAIDGIKAVTFTSGIIRDFVMPGSKYQDIMIKGLGQICVSEKEASKYLERLMNIKYLE